jgi:hypothetical protein
MPHCPDCISFGIDCSPDSIEYNLPCEYFVACGAGEGVSEMDLDYPGWEAAAIEADRTGYVTLGCGCRVEPDGECPCGNWSPLVEAGML